jgi:FKBP-type peptidyl-prolyl cis-trans isomerase SlyD
VIAFTVSNPSDGGQSTKTNECDSPAGASVSARNLSPSPRRARSAAVPARSGFDGIRSRFRKRVGRASSAGGAPLVYLQGAGNIIPGLEKALEGKNVGDELTVAVEPEDAYGEYSAELVSTLSRSMFEGVDELEVGMQFHASAPDGQMQIVTIRDLDGDDVTVDGNHPLAGQRLNFKVKIVDIRDASQEEIAHGHVHGEGGHHH